VVGTATGLWVLLSVYMVGHSPPGGACTLYCGVPSAFVEVWSLLSVLLILVSIGGIVGPRVAYLVGALLAALTLVLVLDQYAAETNEFLWVTMALAGLTFALDLVTSRQTSSFSEQSNPMNLPVFG